MGAPASTVLKASKPNYQAVLTTKPFDPINTVDVPAAAYSYSI